MKIKLFVSHRIDLDSKVIKNDIIQPVYCGATYKHDKWDPDIIGDNTGDNISNKRISYCELTVQYWAWKNIQADYYGLCHYRRYFALNNENIGFRNEQNQIYLPFLNSNKIKTYSLADQDKIYHICKKFSVIIPEPAIVNKIKPFGKTVSNVLGLWEEYDKIFLKKESIYLLLKTIKEFKPNFYPYAINYLYDNKHIGYNCYILSKNYFYELCSFQFNILSKIDISLISNNNKYPRTLGYLSEIMFGMFIYKMIKENNTTIKFLPLIFIENASNNIDILSKYKTIIKVYGKLAINTFCPNLIKKYIKILYHKHK